MNRLGAVLLVVAGCSISHDASEEGASDGGASPSNASASDASVGPDAGTGSQPSTSGTWEDGGSDAAAEGGVDPTPEVVPAPLLVEMVPNVVRAGHVVSIAGRDFGDVRGDGHVRIGDVEAETLVWSATHIVAKVPALVDGPAEVEVAVSKGPATRSLLTISSTAKSPTMPTFVSMGFDDTHASQSAVRGALAPYGFHATFFVNSPRIGKPGMMDLSQLQGLATDGHEIGGHTLQHIHLPLLEPDEQRRQVCDDRLRLLDLGFDVRSFAYPGGKLESVTRQIVADCGYNGARTNTGGQVAAVPAIDSFAVDVGETMLTHYPITQMQGWVTQREATGGWVNLVFHQVCDGCSDSSLAKAKLDEFAAWLAARKHRGTVVRTFGEMTGGPAKPGVKGPAPLPPDSGSSLLRNGSFEQDANSDGVPDCWFRGDPGRPVFFTRTATASAGSFGESLDAPVGSTYTDRRIRSIQDSGSCAVPVAATKKYRLSVSHKGASRVVLSVSFRDETGFWGSWTDDTARPPAAANWTRLSWDLPVPPSGTSAMAIGAIALDTGATSFDDFTVEVIEP